MQTYRHTDRGPCRLTNKLTIYVNAEHCLYMKTLGATTRMHALNCGETVNSTTENQRLATILNEHVMRFFACSTKWKSVIGLEVHAQISSETKLFSGAPNKFSSPVNTNVSNLDCSIPGTLPVLNRRCVQAGVLTALSLNCTVHPISYFDRKHYFYADLPIGYQITQQRAPLATGGALDFQVYTPGVHKAPYSHRVRIKQLQLEQDSGKSLHDFDRSLVDLNRAGAPLMELVFEPDLSDGEEAAALIKELIIILQKIGSCSCKMEEGALRVDANVSIHQQGEPLGTRTEVKNIGSVRGVAGAIKHEITRQIQLKESGQKIINETRAWDALKKVTVAMRDKEVLQDYRYMPEPNLPPLHVGIGPVKNGCVHIDSLRELIPELPHKTRERLQRDFCLTAEQSIVLVNDFSLLNIFETTLEHRNRLDAKLVANFLINDVNKILNKRNVDLDDINYVQPDAYGEIIELFVTKVINRNTALMVFEELIDGPTQQLKPFEIVEQKGWKQITDDSKLRSICENVLLEHEKVVKQYKNGKLKVYAVFLGAVFKKTDGRADMPKVDKLLKELLK